MKCPVFYKGKEVGWVLTEQKDCRVSWKAACKVETDGILRLYGVQTDREPFRVGVMEPGEDGTLYLSRTVSQSELAGAGYDTLPDTYLLSENGQVASGLHTGDAKLDALIDSGQAACRLCDGSLSVSVPFVPGKACPMAFALTACTIENGKAVLYGNKTGLFKIHI